MKAIITKVFEMDDDEIKEYMKLHILFFVVIKITI